LIKLGQVVGRAGFLVESDRESWIVYPGENEVSVQSNVSFIGVKRSGRNQNSVPAQVDTNCTGIKRSDRN
jgi:hypothetical protein